MARNRDTEKVRRLGLERIRRRNLVNVALTMLFLNFVKYILTFNSRVPNVLSKAFFPFWAKMKIVITAPCDDFCKKFLSRNQHHEL